MGKFAIMCPNCGNYVTAYNGLRGLVKNKITCQCGEEINVRMERMTTAICPHCGNNVIYDQGKKSPLCPVCRQQILPSEGKKIISFKCPECGVGISAVEGTAEFDCPICDIHIDVQKEIAKAAYAEKGMASIIKYEGDNNTLVWKHPIEDFNTGSQLIVHESQEAVFFRDGQALDLFGAGRHTLETNNLPLMDKIYKLPTGDTKATFHSEVYFINIATIMNVKWGTDSKIRVFDPASGMHIAIGASGEFNIRVVDSRRILLKLVGTTSGLIMNQRQEEVRDLEEGKKDKTKFSSRTPVMNQVFRSMIMTRVKSCLAGAIKENNINILEIDARLDELSDVLGERINEGLKEYGLFMPQFFVTTIVTPEDDPTDPMHKAFKEYRQLFAAETLRTKEQRVEKNVAEAARETLTVKAQTEAQMKIIEAQGSAEALRIQEAAKAQAYKMHAEAEAEEMRMKGYTYQQETSRAVGLEAMKHGITGEGNGSAAGGLGELAGLGVSLGAMGGVINMTREAMSPLTEAGSQIGQSVIPDAFDTWACSCGRQQIRTRFCPDCGREKPVPAVEEIWDCPKCGKKGISTKFCPECGTKKIKSNLDGWDCPKCGTKGIQTKFCPECGTKKPEQETWTCPECGTADLTGKWCPECGHKRGEQI